MPKFIVISGTLLTAGPKVAEGRPKPKQIPVGFGGEVEMSAEDHRAVDPKGESLVTPEAFAELKKAADAHRAFLAKQKEIGASQVDLSPKLLAAFDRLAVSEAIKKPTKSEPQKGK